MFSSLGPNVMSRVRLESTTLRQTTKYKALKAIKRVSKVEESCEVPMAKANKISVDVVKAPEKMTVPMVHKASSPTDYLPLGVTQ